MRYNADLMIAHKHVFVFNNYDKSCMFHSINYSKHFFAGVYFAANVNDGKLSYLFIVLMGRTITMVVNIQYYFLSLDLIPKWLTRDIG